MSAIDWAVMWRPERHPLETVLRAAIAYLFVLVAFRRVGRKELGRHTTSDVMLLLFITVAMRTTIVGNDPSLTTGMIGLTTFLAINAILAHVARVSPGAANLIEGPVRELVRSGRVDDAAMRKARVSREQLLAAVRGHGGESLDRVGRATLERSGHISVIFRDGRGGTEGG